MTRALLPSQDSTAGPFLATALAQWHGNQPGAAGKGSAVPQAAAKAALQRSGKALRQVSDARRLQASVHPHNEQVGGSQSSSSRVIRKDATKSGRSMLTSNDTVEESCMQRSRNALQHWKKAEDEGIPAHLLRYAMPSCSIDSTSAGGSTPSRNQMSFDEFGDKFDDIDITAQDMLDKYDAADEGKSPRGCAVRSRSVESASVEWSTPSRNQMVESPRNMLSLDELAEKLAETNITAQAAQDLLDKFESSDERSSKLTKEYFEACNLYGKLMDRVKKIMDNMGQEGYGLREDGQDGFNVPAEKYWVLFAGEEGGAAARGGNAALLDRDSLIESLQGMHKQLEGLHWEAMSPEFKRWVANIEANQVSLRTFLEQVSDHERELFALFSLSKYRVEDSLGTHTTAVMKGLLDFYDQIMEHRAGFEKRKVELGLQSKRRNSQASSSFGGRSRMEQLERERASITRQLEINRTMYEHMVNILRKEFPHLTDTDESDSDESDGLVSRKKADGDDDSAEGQKVNKRYEHISAALERCEQRANDALDKISGMWTERQHYQEAASRLLKQRGDHATQVVDHERVLRNVMSFPDEQREEAMVLLERRKQLQKRLNSLTVSIPADYWLPDQKKPPLRISLSVVDGDESSLQEVLAKLRHGPKTRRFSALPTIDGQRSVGGRDDGRSGDKQQRVPSGKAKNNPNQPKPVHAAMQTKKELEKELNEATAALQARVHKAESSASKLSVDLGHSPFKVDYDEDGQLRVWFLANPMMPVALELRNELNDLGVAVTDPSMQAHWEPLASKELEGLQKEASVIWEAFERESKARVQCSEAKVELNKKEWRVETDAPLERLIDKLRLWMARLKTRASAANITKAKDAETAGHAPSSELHEREDGEWEDLRKDGTPEKVTPDLLKPGKEPVATASQYAAERHTTKLLQQRHADLIAKFRELEAEANAAAAKAGGRLSVRMDDSAASSGTADDDPDVYAKLQAALSGLNVEAMQQNDDEAGTSEAPSDDENSRRKTGPRRSRYASTKSRSSRVATRRNSFESGVEVPRSLARFLDPSKRRSSQLQPSVTATGLAPSEGQGAATEGPGEAGKRGSARRGAGGAAAAVAAAAAAAALAPAADLDEVVEEAFPPPGPDEAVTAGFIQGEDKVRAASSSSSSAPDEETLLLPGSEAVSVQDFLQLRRDDPRLSAIEQDLLQKRDPSSFATSRDSFRVWQPTGQESTPPLSAQESVQRALGKQEQNASAASTPVTVQDSGGRVSLSRASLAAGQTRRFSQLPALRTLVLEEGSPTSPTAQMQQNKLTRRNTHLGGSSQFGPSSQFGASSQLAASTVEEEDMAMPRTPRSATRPGTSGNVATEAGPEKRLDDTKQQVSQLKHALRRKQEQLEKLAWALRNRGQVPVDEPSVMRENWAREVADARSVVNNSSRLVDTWSKKFDEFYTSIAERYGEDFLTDLQSRDLAQEEPSLDDPTRDQMRRKASTFSGKSQAFVPWKPSSRSSKLFSRAKDDTNFGHRFQATHDKRTTGGKASADAAFPGRLIRPEKPKRTVHRRKLRTPPTATSLSVAAPFAISSLKRGQHTRKTLLSVESRRRQSCRPAVKPRPVGSAPPFAVFAGVSSMLEASSHRKESIASSWLGGEQIMPTGRPSILQSGWLQRSWMGPAKPERKSSSKVCLPEEMLEALTMRGTGQPQQATRKTVTSLYAQRLILAAQQGRKLSKEQRQQVFIEESFPPMVRYWMQLRRAQSRRRSPGKLHRIGLPNLFVVGTGITSWSYGRPSPDTTKDFQVHPISLPVAGAVHLGRSSMDGFDPSDTSSWLHHSQDKSPSEHTRSAARQKRGLALARHDSASNLKDVLRAKILGHALRPELRGAASDEGSGGSSSPLPGDLSKAAEDRVGDRTIRLLRSLRQRIVHRFGSLPKAHAMVQLQNHKHEKGLGKQTFVNMALEFGFREADAITMFDFLSRLAPLVAPSAAQAEPCSPSRRQDLWEDDGPQPTLSAKGFTVALSNIRPVRSLVQLRLRLHRLRVQVADIFAVCDTKNQGVVDAVLLCKCLAGIGVAAADARPLLRKMALQNEAISGHIALQSISKRAFEVSMRHAEAWAAAERLRLVLRATSEGLAEYEASLRKGPRPLGHKRRGGSNSPTMDDMPGVEEHSLFATFMTLARAKAPNSQISCQGLRDLLTSWDLPAEDAHWLFQLVDRKKDGTAPLEQIAMRAVAGFGWRYDALSEDVGEFSEGVSGGASKLKVAKAVLPPEERQRAQQHWDPLPRRRTKRRRMLHELPYHVDDQESSTSGGGGSSSGSDLSPCLSQGGSRRPWRATARSPGQGEVPIPEESLDEVQSGAEASDDEPAPSRRLDEVPPAATQPAGEPRAAASGEKVLWHQQSTTSSEGRRLPANSLAAILKDGGGSDSPQSSGNSSWPSPQPPSPWQTIVGSQGMPPAGALPGGSLIAAAPSGNAMQLAGWQLTAGARPNSTGRGRPAPDAGSAAATCPAVVHGACAAARRAGSVPRTESTDIRLTIRGPTDVNASPNGSQSARGGYSSRPPVASQRPADRGAQVAGVPAIATIPSGTGRRPGPLASAAASILITGRGVKS